MIGQVLVVGGFAAFILVQLILIIIAGARRDEVSPLSREFWN